MLQGFLMVGFSTVYTMLPVFSLVLDRDVTGKIAITYPELYKELIKGRSLSYKTFFIWTLVSMYQGAVIMFGALLLFEDEFIHVVAISFTALILTELTMVALTIRLVPVPTLPTVPQWRVVPVPYPHLFISYCKVCPGKKSCLRWYRLVPCGTYIYHAAKIFNSLLQFSKYFY